MGLIKAIKENNANAINDLLSNNSIISAVTNLASSTRDPLNIKDFIDSLAENELGLPALFYAAAMGEGKNQAIDAIFERISQLNNADKIKLLMNQVHNGESLITFASKQADNPYFANKLLGLIKELENSSLEASKFIYSEINKKNSEGNTPLHHMFNSKNTKGFDLLLQLNAIPYVKNKANQSAYDIIFAAGQDTYGQRSSFKVIFDRFNISGDVKNDNRNKNIIKIKYIINKKYKRIIEQTLGNSESVLDQNLEAVSSLKSIGEQELSDLQYIDNNGNINTELFSDNELNTLGYPTLDGIKRLSDKANSLFKHFESQKAAVDKFEKLMLTNPAEICESLFAHREDTTTILTSHPNALDTIKKDVLKGNEDQLTRDAISEYIDILKEDIRNIKNTRNTTLGKLKNYHNAYHEAMQKVNAFNAEYSELKTIKTGLSNQAAMPEKWQLMENLAVIICALDNEIKTFKSEGHEIVKGTTAQKQLDYLKTCKEKLDKEYNEAKNDENKDTVIWRAGEIHSHINSLKLNLEATKYSGLQKLWNVIKAPFVAIHHMVHKTTPKQSRKNMADFGGMTPMFSKATPDPDSLTSLEIMSKQIKAKTPKGSGRA
jgi:hypothetical protein